MHMYIHVYYTQYVHVLRKTDLNYRHKITEIHFLPVRDSHTNALSTDTNALSRDTKHLRLDGQVCFYRPLFSDAVKPRGRIS